VKEEEEEVEEEEEEEVEEKEEEEEERHGGGEDGKERDRRRVGSRHRWPRNRGAFQNSSQASHPNPPSSTPELKTERR